MAISKYFIAVFTVLIFLNLATQSHCSSQNLPRLFEKWMRIHNRNYSSTQEKDYRFNLFKKEVEYVGSFNSQKDGKLRHTVGINQFSDMTDEEFLDAVTYTQHLNEVKKSLVGPSHVKYQPTDEDPPNNIDWRAEGYVTRVRDQGSCGASWAFAAVAVVEGYHMFTDSELVEMSEQQLIDCDKSYIQKGCKFGDVQQALDYIEKNTGLASEVNYMYKGVDNTVCDKETETKKQVGKVSWRNYIQLADEAEMAKALAQKPIVATINIGPNFRNYAGGVFGVSTEDVCGSGTLSVAIVGMGVTEGDDPVDFWILKNSWGEAWGEKGYMRIVRNRNLCGLSTRAFGLIDEDYD